MLWSCKRSALSGQRAGQRTLTMNFSWIDVLILPTRSASFFASALLVKNRLILPLLLMSFACCAISDHVLFHALMGVEE